MKVLTVIEPWGTLIAKGFKHIETRSWRTHYRGDILIHCGKKKINYKDFPELERIVQTKKLDLRYGEIICKAQLVDCIEMDEDFIKEVHLNTEEFVLGFYEVGRFAWILEEIEELRNPIPVSGKLSLWEWQGNTDVI